MKKKVEKNFLDFCQVVRKAAGFLLLSFSREDIFVQRNNKDTKRFFRNMILRFLLAKCSSSCFLKGGLTLCEEPVRTVPYM